MSAPPINRRCSQPSAQEAHMLRSTARPPPRSLPAPPTKPTALPNGPPRSPRTWLRLEGVESVLQRLSENPVGDEREGVGESRWERRVEGWRADVDARLAVSGCSGGGG